MELTGQGGLTCQEDAETQQAKKTPTSQVSSGAAPSRGHLAPRRSGSLGSLPAGSGISRLAGRRLGDQELVASLGHPGAVSVAKSCRDRKSVSAGASGSRGCGRLTWRLAAGRRGAAGRGEDLGAAGLKDAHQIRDQERAGQR